MHAGVAERAMAIVMETHSFTPKGVRGIVSLPAAHATQSLSASLPVDARCLPAAQSTHAVADNGVAAYFPAPHATQSASPSLGVCLPAHRQWQISAKWSAASRG